MTSLLRKELWGLLPLLAVVLFIMAGEILWEPFDERLDDESWTDITPDLLPGRGGGHVVGLLILGLVAAYSAFPREHDERTIEFLYSLPIPRWQIFASKFLAGAIVLWVGILAEQLVAWLLQAANPESFGGRQWRVGLAFQVGMLECALATIVLCHGFLVSFLRKFGLILVAMAGWGTIFVADSFPQFASLDAGRLLALEYRGVELVVPWQDLALHAGLAAVSLGLSYFLWMGPAQRLHELYVKSQSGSPAKAVCGCCGTILVVLVIGGFVISMLERDRDPPSEDVEYVSWQTADAESEHYSFRYPTNLRGRALRLIARADQGYESVRDLLGAKGDARIVVDLTEISDDHAGIAAWQKIRMGLHGSDDDATYLRVFHHETTHAFQFQESDRRMSENSNAARFFAEGSAEWVAYELVPAPQERRRARQTALAAWRRQRIRFEDLVDSKAFSVRHDTNMVYALGETWTAALVHVGGRDAVGKVLRSMARPNAPRDLEPREFWQDTLQSAGYNVEEVASAWESLMAGLARDEAEFLAALPVLGGGVAASDSETVELLATLDRPGLPGVRYQVRVRDHSGVRDTRIRSIAGEVQDDPQRVRFSVPRELLRGRAFEFQFGQQIGEGVWPYFEPWQSAQVPR